MYRLFILFCLTLFASECLAAQMIERNETWSGVITIDSVVNVPADSTLIIAPGAELRFVSDAAIAVEGRLLAMGTTEKPIVFRPDPGSTSGAWQGISFGHGTTEGSELMNVSIEGAAQALSITGAKVRISSSIVRGGAKGISSGAGAYLLAEAVTLSDLSEGGIDVGVGSQGKIVGCQIKGVTGFGIQVGKKSTISIRNNLISGAKLGIFVSGEFPPIEGNIIDHCEVGVVTLQTNPNSIIRGNTITDSNIGIACQQFASPTVEKNIVEGCEVGIECFQASSPSIHHNRLARNRRALSCIQMCNPVVMQNDFLDNAAAAYLHLSSYAQFQENNFEGNQLHIELDNMSYDWEVRAGKKPKRNRQAQNEVLVQQGRAIPEEVPVNVESEGFINAKNNYWGRQTTAEMNAKGPDANISTIQDAFDVPTRTYEGWPGEYKQDRVRYDGWKKERIAGTGIDSL